MTQQYAALQRGKRFGRLPSVLKDGDAAAGDVSGVPVLKLFACAVVGMAIIATMLSSTGALSGPGSTRETAAYQEQRLALLHAAHERLDAEITGAARYAPGDAPLASDFEYREIAADPYWRSGNRPEDRLGNLAGTVPSNVQDEFDFVQIELARVRSDERRCLTEAMYYEAAFEPDLGQFAVADVVLNRVRNPLYPNSICAVVYQGASRKTGCQFSFTCDGSLERGRSETLYAALEQRAGAILAGIHLPVSDNATHYHANYVSPYWASSLEPTTQIGAHKFYRRKLKPSLGRSAGLRE